MTKIYHWIITKEEGINGKNTAVEASKLYAVRDLL